MADKTISLFCSAGMSTSLLVSKMKKVATAKGVDYDIEAFPASDLSHQGPKADVILLGPQVRYMESQTKKDFPDKPVAVIDMRSYGMMDGDKVLTQAEGLMK